MSAATRILPDWLQGSSFARQALTIAGGVATGQAIVIALSPALSRLYTPTEMGLLGFYTSFAGMLAVSATGGYEHIIMLPRAHRQAAAMLAFLILLASTVALTLVVPLLLLRSWLADLLGIPALSLWLAVLPLSVAFLAWYQGFRFWAMRRGAFGDVACNTVVRLGLGSLLACLLGLWPPTDLPGGGLILSAILAEAIGNLLLLRGIWRRDRHLFRGLSSRRLRALARRWRGLAVGIAVSQEIAILYQRLPILGLGWLFGPAAAGLYVWAMRFATLPSQLIANAIGDVYRQRATVEFHRIGRFDALMLRTLKTTALLAVVPYALGAWLAPWLFDRLFGPAWAEAGSYAAILMVSDFVGFVITPIDKAAVIRRRTGYILAWNIARVIGDALIIAYALVTAAGVYTFLWLLVALQVMLYAVDLAYSLHLARGRAWPEMAATLAPERRPPNAARP